MKLLTFTTLYPNSVQIRHGIFVEQRLRHLLASATQITSKVVAPVPWFPFKHQRFGQYSEFALVPAFESRHNIDVHHPRYPVIPKVGMAIAPFLLAAAALPSLRRLIRQGYDFDLIDAHYFYPDGVAAALLGKYLDKPVVITARGSDVNLISQYAIPQRLILWAAKQAHAVITVSQALQQKLIRLGVDTTKITVLRNGVDLQLFTPNRSNQIQPNSPQTLLSVGNLVPLKGHDILLQALTKLPNMQLWIVGDGPEKNALQQLTNQLDIADRVTFLGVVKQEQLTDYYSNADILVLASSSEGWPNVLLEAMACGTPVVATNVNGIPEIVRTPASGTLVDERSPEAFIKGIRALQANYPDRVATRQYAEQFSWDETSNGQLMLFQTILGQIQGIKHGLA